MSRIGKIPVAVPKDVKVAVESGLIRCEGPKGKLALNIPDGLTIENKDGRITIGRAKNTKQCRTDHGTLRANLVNMVQGVSKGHKKELEIQGVGFRAQLQGAKLVMNLGFSHPVEFPVPKEVKVAVPQPTSITIEGVDKAFVGMVAANIRDIKRPEPYKGKGIRYLKEVVRRKQGKSVTK